MTMKIFPFIALLFVAAACQQQPTAEEIIDRSIEAYGGQKVYNSIIEFDFRKRHYVAKYHNNRFELKRIFTDTLGNHYVDVLTNEGFTRTVNDSLAQLDDEWRGKYASSVNSVIYFFRIPFVLKDPAVIAELLGTTQMDGKEYYEVKVTFKQEGGGEDYSDTFIYWIDTQSYFIDYFAYEYHTNGGGKRFRKAINPRVVNGLRIVDYINYKPKDLQVDIADYDQYFFEGGLEELSRIINTNVTVEYLQAGQ